MSYTGIMDRWTGDSGTREMGVESFTEWGIYILQIHPRGTSTVSLFHTMVRLKSQR